MKTITYNPETHVLVPREPSEEMLRKATKVDLGKDCDEKGICINLYQVMLAAAPQPEPVDVDPMAMLPFAILDDELADLRRFTDCADDGEGYDVPKNRMKRLAEIGLLRHVSAGYYEHTVFGLSVLNGDFTTPQPDRTAELEAALKVARDALIAYSNGASGAIAKINEVLHD